MSTKKIAVGNRRIELTPLEIHLLSTGLSRYKKEVEAEKHQADAVSHIPKPYLIGIFTEIEGKLNPKAVAVKP